MFFIIRFIILFFISRYHEIAENRAVIIYNFYGTIEFRIVFIKTRFLVQCIQNFISVSRKCE